MSLRLSVLLTFTLSFFIRDCVTISDLGKWDISLTRDYQEFNKAKPLYKGSQIFVRLNCQSPQPVNITIRWTLQETMCWADNYHYQEEPYSLELMDNILRNGTAQQIQAKITQTCLYNDWISLEQHMFESEQQKTNVSSGSLKKKEHNRPEHVPLPLCTVRSDGVYIFSLIITSEVEFNVSTHIEMMSTNGYLSAAAWPLLPFYGVMCGVYSILGIGWLLVSWLQWRDLLRIQFWIGGVALLGMLESATFYGVYASMNSTGHKHDGAILFAEWVSIAKRTLARMLVIIVSLGFGIVKPRLGPALQRVAGACLLWGLLAAIESWLRLNRQQGATPGDILVAEAPLAMIDSAICWWVFVSLAHTMRTLRLRRNMVKFSLYRHFTNTLIFAVVSSIIFTMYSVKMHRYTQCLTNWKDLWVEEAYWHILFASVLSVIIVLWRPTNNNQRYAFTPLLDNADDEDEEEEHFVNDAYGVKMRGGEVRSGGGGGSGVGGGSAEASAAQQEADLRWVEENLPSSALPVLDSDEEILNTKFEVSKMQ